MRGLQSADDRVTLPDRRPARSIVVERQAARDLPADGVDIVGPVEPRLDDPAWQLADIDGGAALPAFDRKRHREPGVRRLAAADPGCEAARERSSGVEGERAAGLDLERLHPRSMGGFAADTPMSRNRRGDDC